MPLAIFGLTGLLGWRFHRTKVVFAQAVLALTFVGASQDKHGCLRTAAEFAGPIAIAMLFVAREVGIFSLRALVRASYIAVAAWLAGIACQHYAGYATTLEKHVYVLNVAGTRLAFTWISIAWLASMLLVGLFPSREPKTMKLSFMVSILLFGLGSNVGGHVSGVSPGLIRSLASSGASAVMALGLVQLSYSMAYKDPLTGLPGRRALEEALDRLSGKYSIAMLDVDHFKRFNDRYGHEVGDQVLKMVASKMKKTSRGKAYRYGGEEFTIVFNGLDASKAAENLEALRAEIQSGKLTIRGRRRPRKKPEKTAKSKKKTRQKKVSVTVSMGVTSPKQGKAKPRDVLKEADKLLYKAKKAGRNRVVYK